MVRWLNFKKKSKKLEESTNIRLLAKVSNYYYRDKAS